MHSNEGAFAILRKLLVKPMSVEPGSLAMLDLAIYMKQADLSKRIIEGIYEYRWLSRGEIKEDMGVKVGDVDKVLVDESVKNSLIDLERIEGSKVLNSFAERRGLSARKALYELRKRARAINDMLELTPEEIRKKVELYGVGLE